MGHAFLTWKVNAFPTWASCLCQQYSIEESSRLLRGHDILAKPQHSLMTETNHQDKVLEEALFPLLRPAKQINKMLHPCGITGWWEEEDSFLYLVLHYTKESESSLQSSQQICNPSPRELMLFPENKTLQPSSFLWSQRSQPLRLSRGWRSVPDTLSLWTILWKSTPALLNLPAFVLNFPRMGTAWIEALSFNTMEQVRVASWTPCPLAV